MDSINKKNSGYLAIITAIFLAGIITALTFALSGSTLLARYNTLISRDKKASRYLAESCLETARWRLIQNNVYAGNETISVGSETCYIAPIEAAPGQKIITASGAVAGGKTILKLTVNDLSLTLIKIQELSN